MTGAMLGFPGEDYTTPRTIQNSGGFGNPAGGFGGCAGERPALAGCCAPGAVGFCAGGGVGFYLQFFRHIVERRADAG